MRYETINVDGRQMVEHRKIWEETHGMKIPPGCEIHHADGKSKNNAPSNLVLLTVSEHRKLHARLRKAGKDVVDPNDPDVVKAREATKKWCDAHPEYFQKWRETHRENNRKSSKKFREEHLDEVKAREAKYRATHKEERKALFKTWYDDHQEEQRERAKKYYYEHPENQERNREKAKNWYAQNKERAKARIAKWSEEHKPLLQAQSRLRSAIKRGASQVEIDQHRAEITRLKIGYGMKV